MGIRDYIREKFFSGQQITFQQENGWLMPDDIQAVKAYNVIAAATRAINLIAEYAAPVEINAFRKDRQMYIRAEKSVNKIERFLDFPNPTQSKIDFWTEHYTYLMLYGTAFIVLEKDGFYNLLPTLVTIMPGERGFIDTLTYGDGANAKNYKPEEVAIVRLPAPTSRYIGTGIYDKLSSEINLVNKMLSYQGNSLNNGGVHKYAFASDNVLGEKLKAKIRDEWKKFHSIGSKSAGLPPILDGGIKLTKIDVSMADLDFNKSIDRLEISIIKNLGVPPELMGGNTNIDLSKSMRLFFINTVLPLLDKTTSALTLLLSRNPGFFRIGNNTYYIKPDLRSVLALREDSATASKSAQSLYVSGIITKNEARIRNNFPEDPDPEADEYMVPQNIAGSNVNPSTGGRPPKTDDEEDND